MNDFENTKKTKYRFKKLGKTPDNEEFYSVECKDANDKNSQWEGGIAGTAEFLGLTPQQIAWAK